MRTTPKSPKVKLSPSKDDLLLARPFSKGKQDAVAADADNDGTILLNFRHVYQKHHFAGPASTDRFGAREIPQRARRDCPSSSTHSLASFSFLPEMEESLLQSGIPAVNVSARLKNSRLTRLFASFTPRPNPAT
jgi:hypothetical protein